VTTVISKLLIANRGEIAARIMRTARAMNIASVALYSDADRHAPYVLQSDESVHLPGLTPAETYLRSDLVLEAAALTGADAVHPGYGFLSENADFARACASAELIFVGPSPDAIEAMGSKIAAKDMMRAAGVPVLPSATVGSGAEADPDLLLRAGADIGYPLLVKAAFGGGGRGMRIVGGADDLCEAVASARREAASAFSDGTVFLERFVENPRHIEMQIFGDRHGTVVQLGERECSIQRRYQKIIEESPSTAVDQELRGELGRAAIAAGKALDYEGAGTVEFIVAQDGTFYFLEVNTRLQVEHPVTEMVTGIDLVRAQIVVASGGPMPAEVRDSSSRGHAVEARLYAEDAAAGYVPASGTLVTLRFPEMDGVRVDAGFTSGSHVSTHYDPMLAKIIGFGPTRDEACDRLARALRETLVHGVTSNRDLLIAILEEPEFRTGAIDTGYLERHPAAELLTRPVAVADRIHALVAALAAQARRRGAAKVLSGLPSGWRTLCSQDQAVSYTAGGEQIDVSYRFDRNALFAAVDGQSAAVRVISACASRVDAEINGIRRHYLVTSVGVKHYVDSALGSTELTEVMRFPDPRAAVELGSLLAPMPASVVRIEVDEGAAVAAGTPIVVLEAMKMEHTVRAPADGVVTAILVQVGGQIDAGQVLAVVHSGEE
jgi:propionyl-CoA carboxylase alpha chain